MVAAPSRWNALLVAALEFAFRALAIQVGAESRVFVTIVRTVVFKITPPAHWNASVVLALEVARVVALGTQLRVGLIGIVETVILVITEEPAWNAAVVEARGTLEPASAAVLVATQECRLVAVVAC